MGAALAEVKQEWRHFRHDKPGERFRNHRERMKRKSKKHSAVAIALGVLLLAGGVVLLFMPGPGILLIVFGVALVGSHSEKISDMLDRAEPKAREKGHALSRWWKARSRVEKIALVTTAVVLATLGLMAMWKWVVAAYIL